MIMKRTRLILMAMACLVASGCTNMPKLVTALAKDPATAYIEMIGHGVVIRLVRTNPNTNTLAHAIGKDGTVTVTK